MAGHAGIGGLPPFPPNDVVDWLFYLPLPFLVVEGVWIWFWRPPRPLRLGGRLGACALFVFLLLRPLLAYAWVPQRGIIVCGAITLLLFGLWSIIERIEGSHGEEKLAAAVGLWVLLGGSAIPLALAGSLKLGQLAGAAALAWTPLLWVVLREGSPLLPVLPLYTFLFGGFLLGGYFYAALPHTALVLLALTPLLLKTLPPRFPLRQRWKRVAIDILFAVIPMLIALLIVHFLGDQDGGRQ
ncbi:MAG: hypothetical protein D6812_13290 [Deltaproteobacteria bacterium]|nr:MAG: hypothetical protein D6812_13290 [Deltaproteobacteria bacterium]